MQHGKFYSRDVYASADGLPADLLAQIPDKFDLYGQTIHRARNQIKVYQKGNLNINVKKYCIPPIINRILYSLGLRTPKAKSTYKNALEILKRGFQTPRPLGYVIERSRGLINYSYFVSEQITHMQPIQHHCIDKNLIRALARYTARLHLRGLMHKDYTPGNILYKETNGTYSFMLVDINRFHIQTTPINPFMACHNLIKPFENDEMLIYFVKQYARLRKMNTICVYHVLLLRHVRNVYDKMKVLLKKIPGAHWLLGKPVDSTLP